MTINIPLGKSPIFSEKPISTKQIKVIQQLCREHQIEFPFEDLEDIQSKLSMKNAWRAIKELNDGNRIEFV
jgi:hypothetical protein